MKLKLIYLFILCLPSLALAQEEVQSSGDDLNWKGMYPERSMEALKAYQKLFDNLYDWESAEQQAYLTKGLEASKKLKNDTTAFIFAYELGRGYISSDSLFLSITYLNEAVSFAKSNGAKKKAYNLLGYCFSELADFQTALDYYFKSVELVKKDNPTSAAFTFVNISGTYMYLEDYKNTIKYTNYANELASQMKSPTREYISIFNYTRLAKAYASYNKKDSSLFYVNLALQTVNSIDTIKENRYKEAVKMAYVESIENYLEFEMPEAAATLLNKVKNYKLTYYKSTVIVQEARYEMQKANYAKALSIIDLLDLESLHFTEKDEAIKLKIECYKKIGNKDNALELYEKLIQLRKEELESDRTKVSMLADVKFETLKKNEAIKSLQLDQQVKDLALVNQRYIILLVILLALSLLALALYMRKRAKERESLSEYLQNQVDAKTQDLQKANEELRVMNYIASHDLKEPMRNIGNYIGLIRKKIPDETKGQLNDYFNIVQNNIRQLYTLVEDVATYINMSKEEVVDLELVNMNQLASSLFFSLDTYREEQNGSLENKGMPDVSTSSTMMYIILKNLVENGLKYNKSEVPTVELAYREVENYHQILVSDNGIGIKEEYHDKIFDSFKKLHNKGEFKGSGIGLSIVKLLVRKLNGTIQVESKEGEGSTFIVSLPK